MSKRGAKRAKKAEKKVAAAKIEKEVKKISKVKKADKIKTKGAEFEVTIKSKVLGEAPKQYHFILNDGKKVKSIYELVNALENMSEDVFRHHSNEYKNDFSNWIEHVFDEKYLADEIRQVRDKLETQRKIMRRMINEVLE